MTREEYLDKIRAANSGENAGLQKEGTESRTEYLQRIRKANSPFDTSLPAGVQGPRPRESKSFTPVREYIEQQAAQQKPYVPERTYKTTAEYDTAIADLSRKIEEERQKRGYGKVGFMDKAMDLFLAPSDEEADYQTQIKRLQAEKKFFDYDSFSSLPDFAQHSAVKEDVTDRLYQAVNGKAKYDELPQNPQYYDGNYSMALAGDWLSKNVISDDIQDRQIEQMTDSEKATFNYIYATQGKENAVQYLKDIDWVLNKRAAETEAENQKKEYLYNSNTTEKVALNIASVPAKLFGDITGGLATAVDAIQGDYDPYKAAYKPADFAQNIRGATAQEISEKAGEFAAQNYQAVMSAADSLLGAATLGKGYSIIAAAGAGSQRARVLYEQGASDREILMGSLASAGAEALFEKLSLDKLLDDTAVKSVGALLKKVVLQSGVEASEEMATEIANKVTDAIIRGKNSDTAQAVQMYIENGMDEKDAKKAALLDNVQDVLWAGYGGLISGGFSGGVFAGASYAADTMQTTKLGKMYLNGEGNHSIEEAVQIGLSNAKATEAYKTAEDIKQKAANGEKISPVAVGRMIMESYTEQSVKARQLEAGVWRSAKETGVDQQTMEQIAAVAVRTGRSIAFVSPEQLTLTDENGVPHVAEGQYDPKTGMISLNASLPAETLTNYVIKHELAHSIEGTAAGQKLARIVRNEKGTARFEQEVAAKKSQYAKNGQMLSDTEAAREVVAQWIGENLYKSGFAQAIAAGDADTGNAFVRVLDKIRLALGGSQKSGHASQIAALERLFLRAMEGEPKRENNKYIESQTGQFSIKKDSYGEDVVVIDTDQGIFWGVDPKKYPQVVREYFNERFKGLRVELGEERYVGFSKKMPGEYAYPHTSLDNTSFEFSAKMKAITELDNLMKTAKPYDFADNKKKNKEAREGWDYYTVTFLCDGRQFSGLINIANSEKGGFFYDLTKIKMAPTISDRYIALLAQPPSHLRNHNTKVPQNSFGVNSYSMQDGEKNSQLLSEEIGDTITEEALDQSVTYDEEGAVLAYKNSRSYIINRKLRDGESLSSYEQKIVNDLDNALQKLPVYRGKVYRNIGFDGFGDQEAVDNLLKQYVVGETIELKAYTSTSIASDGYPIDGKFVVHYEIESASGRDLQGHGNNFESEVLIPRNAGFLVNDIRYDEKGTPTIYLREVIDDERWSYKGRDGENTSRNVSRGQDLRVRESIPPEMQRLQQKNSENGDMQFVSKQNTQEDFGRRRMQGVRREIENAEKASSLDGVFFDGNSTLLSDVHYQAAERVKNGPQRTVAEGHTLEDLATELGDEELSRRAYMAFQAEEIPTMVDIDGEEMEAASYIDAVEQLLPDDIGAVQAFIKEAEQQLREEVAKAHENGEESNVSGSAAYLQLVAARRKMELFLDEGEDGSKERRFYWQRLRGLDANETHKEELLEYLAGRSETYNPISNKRTLEQAKNLLRNPSYASKLERRVMRNRPQDRFSETEMTCVMVMINDARNNGEFERYINLAQGLSRKATDAGRAVQVLSMMARMTPEGTLRAAKRIMRDSVDQQYGDGFNNNVDVVGNAIVDAVERAQEQAERSQGGATVPGETGVPAQGTAEQPGTTPNFENATLPELEEALGDKIIEQGSPYITEQQIRDIIRKAVDNSTDLPRQLKKMLQTDEIQKTLAQKIAIIHKAGHLNDATMRQAMEQAMGLPTLTGEEAGHLVELVETLNTTEEGTFEWEKAQDDIYYFLAEKLPSSRLEILTSWRKFAMLANPKTHFRNIASNVAMRGVNKIDSAVATLLQNIFIKDPSMRDAYVNWRGTEFGKQLIADGFLEKQAEKALVKMHGSQKYEMTVGKLAQYKKPFGKSWLGEIGNKMSDGNSRLMEVEDDKSFKPNFIDALGQIMTARETTEITDEIFDLAYDRAAETVFRKENALASVLSGIKKGMFDANTSKGKKALGYIADIVIPFTKTPANIASVTFSHSPLGLVKGAYDLTQMLRGKNNKQAAEIINTFSKGITGSALLMIGLLLGKLGLFNTGYGKTEKERAADELAGIQENAFVFGNVSFTADWLQPAAAPFIVGASIGQRLKEDGLSLAAIGGAILDGTDSLFELTMLQSLYDVLGGYDAGASASAASVAENIVSQSIPTLLGQAARAIDPVQRKTTGDNDFETIINQVIAKVPGLTYLLEPEMDVWGNEVYRTGKASTGSVLVNAFQQFLLPANIKIGTGTEDELSRIILEMYNSNAEKSSRAVPTSATRDEAREMDMLYSELMKQVGTAQRNAVEELISDQKTYSVQVTGENGKKRTVNKRWSQMTEDERLRVMNREYSKAKEKIVDPDEAYFDELIRGIYNGN